MNVAIIPARGGSKRVPRKNVSDFCGKPMIAWSIEAALASDCFDRVVVSTDDDEISAVARSLGAELPFVRPAALSDDHAGILPVMAHAVRWLQRRNRVTGRRFDRACCIFATAPFMQPEDLRTGLSVLEAQYVDYAFTVTSYAYPIQRAVRLTARGRIEMMQPDGFDARSQDFEEAYHDAGQFYWGTADAWLEQRPLFGGGAAPVILPRHRVHDIDTPEDWTRAELIFKALNPGGKVRR
jgi:pseudaminic acid cytidylyltransferase